jgi:hypothetical protein
VNSLIMRLPTELRDGDGVRVDAMLAEIGAIAIRELSRKYPAHVDVLVEHTSAPEEIRGMVVVPIFQEIPDPAGGPDKVLSFERWEPWTP